MKNMILEYVKQFSVAANREDLNCTTSSPPWRYKKRTDYTKTKEAKVKHTMNTYCKEERIKYRGDKQEIVTPGGPRSRSKPSGIRH